MFRTSYSRVASILFGIALSVVVTGGAMGQDEGGTKTARELRAGYDQALKGKTIAFLPIVAFGVPLQDEWGRVIQEEAAWRGMKVVVRDPNNNPTAMQQALTALINDKPDVILVQNPSVTLLVKELRRAESLGIHVIQMNMGSNYKSSAFVGVDYREIGRLLAEETVKECGTGTGKSGKVQIVQGELTAAASIEQMAGIDEVFKKDPAIKVVSNQSAQWDANNALNITTTVLQQNPDLCASIGFWGIMQSGAGQAIRNAGKLDQVKIYSSAEGSQLDCDLVNQGTITRLLNYKGTEQGHDMFMAISALLQSGLKPGSVNLQFYTRPVWLDKTNSANACFPLVKASTFGLK